MDKFGYLLMDKFGWLFINLDLDFNLITGDSLEKIHHHYKDVINRT